MILKEPGRAHYWKDSKEDVPGRQKASQLERASIGHVRLNYNAISVS